MNCLNCDELRNNDGYLQCSITGRKTYLDDAMHLKVTTMYGCPRNGKEREYCPSSVNGCICIQCKRDPGKCEWSDCDCCDKSGGVDRCSYLEVVG
jgi:hypothetical protein